MVLTNGEPVGVPEAVAARFTDIAQFGAERQDWLTLYHQRMVRASQPFGDLVGQQPPADASPAQDLAAYAGTYRNDYFGPATVSVEGTGLVLELGPTGEWPLTHWTRDTFVFEPFSENATYGSVSRATFTGDTLVLEYFNQHGLGTFRR